MKKLAIILLCAATACTYNLEERKAAVAERAAFDLNCPAEEITVQELPNTSEILGASGCGNRQTYQFWQNLLGTKWVQKEGDGAPITPVTQLQNSLNKSSYSVKPTPLFKTPSMTNSLYGGRTFGAYNGYNGTQAYGMK